MNTTTTIHEKNGKQEWHAPNVYVLRGSVTEKPGFTPTEGFFKQPSSFEHLDAGDPLGFPHGPTADPTGPS
ncbi:MAG: hypothetical protein A2Z16_06095 [Chloroflexi bacterium RBG_16_54_18]|nr:MAG: hypothetical protein A2Z16_06095 [Chloroflexi bacterium RBG_16_54_18]